MVLLSVFQPLKPVCWKSWLQRCARGSKQSEVHQILVLFLKSHPYLSSLRPRSVYNGEPKQNKPKPKCNESCVLCKIPAMIEIYAYWLIQSLPARELWCRPQPKSRWITYSWTCQIKNHTAILLIELRRLSDATARSKDSRLRRECLAR
jgi:hypothetical protein